MIKKTASLRCIFFTLFGVSNLLLLVGIYAVSSSQQPYAKQFSYVKITQSNSFQTSSFNKPVIKNDHIKVRYMGGDCGYDPCSFLVKFTAQMFIEPGSSGHHASFIFSRNYLLFKLRGPPVEIIHWPDFFRIS